MRVLHFNQFGNDEGGTESYIADVFLALSSAGHQSHLVYFSGAKEDSLTPCKTRISDRDQESENNKLAAIVLIIEQFDPDVAFIHVLNDPKLTRIISSMVPSAAYVHSPYLVCPGYTQYFRKSETVCPHRATWRCIIFAQIERCMFGHNPFTHLRRLGQVKSLISIYQGLRILVGSHFMRDLLIRNQIPPQNISILPPLLHNYESIRDYKESRNPHQILFAGRLVKEKGLPLLIKALAPLEVDWKLFVAGDGESRSEFEQLSQDLEIAEKVKFLGWQSQAKMSDLYQSSAIIVVPSLWPEPFGRIGPESFRHGRPVIAFDVGGVRDWLDDGTTGYLVPAGELAKLRDTIMNLLNSIEEQRQLGQQALIKAQTRWQTEEHVEKLIRILKQTIKEHSRSIHESAEKRST